MADKKPAAAAPAPATPGEAKPKPPIVPIVGAALLSAVLVGGLMFFLMPRPDAAPTEDEVTDEPRRAPALPMSYVEIEGALVANLPPGGPAFLQVRVQIGARGEPAKAAIEAHLPAIQSALLAQLRQTTAEELARPDAMTHLQDKALAEVNRVLKAETGQRDTAAAVLFTSFVTQ
jgi:flagellar FliL protein